MTKAVFLPTKGKENWNYSLEKIGMTWHWSLRQYENDLCAWSDCSFTKRGALRAMKRIKHRELNRRKEKGTL